MSAVVVQERLVEVAAGKWWAGRARAGWGAEDLPVL